MLPLINVVFLLLIFFLLAGRLAATDPFPVEAPHALSGERIGGHDMVVHVGADDAWPSTERRWTRPDCRPQSRNVRHLEQCASRPTAEPRQGA